MGKDVERLRVQATEEESSGLEWKKGYCTASLLTGLGLDVSQSPPFLVDVRPLLLASTTPEILQIGPRSFPFSRSSALAHFTRHGRRPPC